MRILFDSNIWISFFISEGVVTEVVDHCVLEHTVFISERIVNEVGRTLKRKFKFSLSDLEDVSVALRKCKFVQEIHIKPVCPDQDDDHILAAAVGGEVDCVVTGDRALLALSPFQGIPILSPNAFWKFEQEGT